MAPDQASDHDHASSVLSLPDTLGTSDHYYSHPPSSSDHSDSLRSWPRRIDSISTVNSNSSTLCDSQESSITSTGDAPESCATCGKDIDGMVARALGAVYHLECFKCMDCGLVVASNFFPCDGEDGKQHPLCEQDYFRRLDLICAKCGMALRGSYILACNKKYHIEHFTCSVCPTLFGPEDSYYEHEGDVYCHLHYSTQFALKCAGCNGAIMTQYVKINRNMRNEDWHPECYADMTNEN